MSPVRPSMARVVVIRVEKVSACAHDGMTNWADTSRDKAIKLFLPFIGAPGVVEMWRFLRRLGRFCPACGKLARVQGCPEYKYICCGGNIMRLRRSAVAFCPAARRARNDTADRPNQAAFSAPRPPKIGRLDSGTKSELCSSFVPFGRQLCFVHLWKKPRLWRQSACFWRPLRSGPSFSAPSRIPAALACALGKTGISPAFPLVPIDRQGGLPHHRPDEESQ